MEPSLKSCGDNETEVEAGQSSEPQDPRDIAGLCEDNERQGEAEESASGKLSAFPGLEAAPPH